METHARSFLLTTSCFGDLLFVVVVVGCGNLM
jgi:hypothetical protein